MVAQGGEQTCEGASQLGLLEVGEFVGEEVNLAGGLPVGAVGLDQPAHGTRREGRYSTLGAERDDTLDDGRRPACGGEVVVEGVDQMAEAFHHGHACHHPAAEGGAVAVVEHLQHLGAYAGHVDVGWAFAFAAFAGQAAVEGLLD